MVKINRKKAFSLVELSVVIIIVSILITGSMSASVTAISNAKNRATKDRLAEIYNALGNYLLVNGTLPCPASLLEVKSGGSYGASVGTAGTCSGTGVYSSSVATNLVLGMVPVRNLGLSNDMAEDAFESKITYIVDKNFTGSAFGTTATYTNTITVNEEVGASTHTLTNDAIFVLVSHGQNKAGAFNTFSATQNARSGQAAETNNDLDSTSSPAYNKTVIYASADNETFDDILFYKTRNAIVSDFNAFSAIYCVSGNLSLNYGGAANYAFAQGSFDQVVVSTTICPVGWRSTTQYPTRRCGAFGTWQSFANNPCTQ